MFTRVLVPLDGSPLAETALLPAKVLARRFGAELYLARTEDPLASIKTSSDTLHSSQAATQDYLDRLALQLTEAGTTAFAMLPPTNPAEEMIAQAELHQVDLIVIAVDGRTRLDMLLRPSDTWQVFSQTSAPILFWRRSVSEELAQPTIVLPRFMTDALAPILVPLDGSLQAEAALPLVQQLAQTFDNPVRLIRVVAYPVIKDGNKMPAPCTEETIQWSHAEAENYLKVQQAPLLVRQGLRVEIEHAVGFPVAALGASAQRYHAGLVVMTAHGRGWFGQPIMGTVATYLLSHLNVPTLLVRPVPAVSHPDQRQIAVEVLEGWAQ